MMSSAYLCMALLVSGCYYTVSASSECPDFSKFDACEDEKFGRLQVSFGLCDSRITPYNAQYEPVVKYLSADQVPSNTHVEY